MSLDWRFRGFDYVSYYNGAYENDDSLPALVQTDANAVETTLDWGIDPQNDTVYADSAYTDPLAAEGATIRQAVAAGLTVMVKPHLDFLDNALLTGTPYSVSDWRTYFNPGAAGSAGANAFFASYKSMLLQEAYVAATNGASVLCIGTELDQIAGPAYKPYWDDIISTLRQDYPSLKLTYAAEWNDATSPWQYGGSGLAKGTGDLATQISFASELDYLGLDVYAPLSDAANPTLQQLIDGWTQTPVDSGATAETYAATGDQSLVSYLLSVQAAVGKPLIFTEVGFENATDAASSPAYSTTNAKDAALQSLLYQAFFDVWSQTTDANFAGAFLYNWDPNSAEVGPGSVAFSPQNLPALSIVDADFQAATRPQSAPDDFNGDGFSDIGLESAGGEISTWQADGGGGEIGNPGAVWTVAAVADLWGDGDSDFVFSNTATGLIAVWRMSGTTIVGAYDIATPGAGWTIVGSGDFYGGDEADLLFRDAAGDLAIWEMNGAAIVGGGTVGNPGSGWSFVGTGDFNGDGDTDLLFLSAAGAYAIWNLDGDAISGGATLGSPGSGWVYKGAGDFNGDGTSDILFENTTTGEYATWDISADKIVGGGDIGAPGPDWTFVSIGAYSGGASDGVLFENVVTGQYASWTLSGATVATSLVYGAPGAGESPLGASPAAAQELPGEIFFQNASGEIAGWNVEGGVNTGGPIYASPGTDWTLLAVGKFYGDNEPDLLFENASGQYALWRTDGSSVIGGGSLGSPGSGWSFAGVGDFNGDGIADILFTDPAGDFATWDMNGTSIVGGGELGNPGSAWTFVGVGDFNEGATSDLLFQNGQTFAIWDIGQNQIVGGATFSGPGSGWALKGVGDFTGDGGSDLLFESAAGAYEIEIVSGDAVVNSTSVGNPGSAWTYAGIADVFGDHQDSILFYDSATSAYATWNLTDATLSTGSALGSPGTGWVEKAFV